MKKILIALFLTTSAMAQEFTPLYSHGIPNYKEVVNKQSAAKGADGIERKTLKHALLFARVEDIAFWPLLMRATISQRSSMK
jgi:hypothetical protein